MKTSLHYLFAAILLLGSLNACKPKTGDNPAVADPEDAKDFAGNDYGTAFVGSFKMTMENGGNAGQTMPTTTFYSNGEQTAIDMVMPGSEKPSRIIMDPATKSMITLMDQGGQKIAMKMKMPDLDTLATNKTAPANDMVTETSETQTISGYKCKKYIIESNSGVTEVWATKQIKGNMGHIFRGDDKLGNQEWAKKMRSLDGFPIEIRTTPANSKEETIIRISEIREGALDSAVFSTEGYEVKDMSQMSKSIEDLAKKYAQ